MRAHGLRGAAATPRARRGYSVDRVGSASDARIWTRRDAECRPARDGRAGHRAAEDVGRLGEAHGAQVAAVGPAVDADAVGVREARANRVVHARDLVVDFEAAEFAVDRGFEREAAPRGAAVVNFDHEVAPVAEVLRPQVRRRRRPLVLTILHVRPAVA